MRRGFFGRGDGAFGAKAESLIASSSTFSMGVGTSFRSDVWQMEFGYRP